MYYRMPLASRRVDAPTKFQTLQTSKTSKEAHKAHTSVRQPHCLFPSFHVESCRRRTELFGEAVEDVSAAVLVEIEHALMVVTDEPAHVVRHVQGILMGLRIAHNRGYVRTSAAMLAS